jgi:hypothetical protein
MGTLVQLNNINKKISKAAKKGGTDFLDAFLDKEEEILNILRSFAGSKSEIFLQEVDMRLKNLITFSSIFSDVTLLNTSGSDIEEFQMAFHDPGHRFYRERKITIPAEYIKETGVDASVMRPIYIHRNDIETKKLFKDFKDLIYDNRLIIRPLRSIYVSKPEIKSGTIYYVDQNTTNDHWHINSPQTTDTIAIDNGYYQIQNIKDLFEVTLPYFEGIDFETLSKILNDENDLLEAMRYDLVKVINEAANDPNKIIEIKKDLALSSIQRLEDKFRKIKSQHSTSIKGNIALFGLTFAVGTISLEAALAPLGTAIFNMSQSNADYQTKLDDMKSDKFYLLWRINKKPSI